MKVAPVTQPRALSIIQGRAVGVSHYLLGPWAFFSSWRESLALHPQAPADALQEVLWLTHCTAAIAFLNLKPGALLAKTLPYALRIASGRPNKAYVG